MTERPNNRVSMGLNSSGPTCKTCPHLKPDGKGWGGWCQHNSNRVFDVGWLQGFTPSQAFDGGCDLHPAHGVALLEQNQCDGCMQGAELRNGLHYDRHGKVFMACERDKYASGVNASAEAQPKGGA